MDFALFLVQAVIISLSGVMAPGPITAVTVGAGARSPHAGAFVAIGHGLIEFPLMVLTVFGLGALLGMEPVKIGVFIVGGGFLLWMGYGMLRAIAGAKEQEGESGANPLVAGTMLTAGNVYFLMWWVTVGAGLIMRSLEFGVAGFIAFAVVHWLCDLVWLLALSRVSYHGGTLLGRRFQQVVYAVCGVFLLVFGAKFIYDAVMIWRA